MRTHREALVMDWLESDVPDVDVETDFDDTYAEWRALADLAEEEWP